LAHGDAEHASDPPFRTPGGDELELLDHLFLVDRLLGSYRETVRQGEIVVGLREARGGEGAGLLALLRMPFAGAAARLPRMLPPQQLREELSRPRPPLVLDVRNPTNSSATSATSKARFRSPSRSSTRSSISSLLTGSAESSPSEGLNAARYERRSY